MPAFQPKNKITAKTKSGIDLGKVVYVEIDILTGKIDAFYISSLHVLPRLFDNLLMVKWNQVVRWEKDTLIVTDTILPRTAKNTVISPSNPETA